MRGRHSKRKRTPQKGEARQAALVPRAFWNCHRRGFRPVALKYFSTVADSLPRTRTHPDHRAPHCLLFNRSFDRFITEARVIACPRLSHSRSLSTTRETTDAAIPEVDERERESFDERKERRDVTIALRFFVFHYPLVLFLHFFFFSFSRALCRRCTFLRFRSSRISIPPRFSLLFGILFHLNFYSSLIRFDISGLELWGIVNNRYRHYCFLLNFRI